MSDLHEDFDPDPREGGLSEETEILNHEMGQPMDIPSEVNIGMWNLVPKTPWIDLSS